MTSEHGGLAPATPIEDTIRFDIKIHGCDGDLQTMMLQAHEDKTADAVEGMKFAAAAYHYAREKRLLDWQAEAAILAALRSRQAGLPRDYYHRWTALAVALACGEQPPN